MHTTGGYSVGTYLTTKWVFDLKEEDTYWCTADIGWVTGHSYIVYGPLQNGATSLMYEGAPNFPEPDRFWAIIDRHKVNIFYTAPTAIRTFIKWGDEWPKKHKLDSLRLLGTVGEPINPEAWMWYREVIGHDRCPIVDTWWQTETGTIMITPIPGAIATKPGSATRPFPGVVPEVVTMEGKPVPDGSGGFLVIQQAVAGMLRTIYGDPDRYVQPVLVADSRRLLHRRRRPQRQRRLLLDHGPRRRRDQRLRPSPEHDGSGIAPWSRTKRRRSRRGRPSGRTQGPGDLRVRHARDRAASPPTELKEELRKWVAKEIGALAKPDDIRFTDMLPKTRSGKDHAPPVARTRHQRRREGRHHDAGRFRRDREAERKRRGLAGPVAGAPS